MRDKSGIVEAVAVSVPVSVSNGSKKKLKKASKEAAQLKLVKVTNGNLTSTTENGAIDNKLKKNLKKLAKRKELKRLQKEAVNLTKSEKKKSHHITDNANQKTPKQHKGHPVKFQGKLSKEFHKIYTEETEFIAKVMKHIPKYGPNYSNENLDDYLLDSSSSDEDEDEQEEFVTDESNGKRKHKGESSPMEVDDEDEADSEDPEDEDNNGKLPRDDDAEVDQHEEETSRQNFLKSLEVTRQEKKSKNKCDDPLPSREELKSRLAAKIEAIRKSKERTSLKPKKKKKKKDKKSDEKTKQFISKSNPNASNSNSGKNTYKDDTNSISSNASSTEQKTPLRKPQVVKSNGQVVYSKFDFISEDKYYDTKQYSHKNKKIAPKPTEMLKKVEKYESKVSQLESSGKISEAVSLTDDKKWTTALKRAQGEKVRDDAALLKKTIRKESKMKQAKQKKWSERKEHIEHQKKKIQDKRSANIQGRKDEKKKRTLKIQRKRGRIA